MKKYLFGLFAIALAVAFSAFTAPKAKVASNKQTLYWYVIESGVATTGTPVSALEDFTKEEVLAENLSCDDNGETVCLAASSFSSLPTEPFPIAHTNSTYFTQNDEYKIKFDE